MASPAFASSCEQGEGRVIYSNGQARSPAWLCGRNSAFDAPSDRQHDLQSWPAKHGASGDLDEGPGLA